MKTKLLRKVRKRFSWYLNSEKRPVLIDNYKREINTYTDIDIAFLLSVQAYSDFIKESEQIKNEKAWNLFKSNMLDDYGYNNKIKKWRFRKATSNFKIFELKNKKYKDE